MSLHEYTNKGHHNMFEEKIRLGVNIDHVATVRNARGGLYPDPTKAAIICEEAGADGITAHLREDRRHILESDIASLMEKISLPLNLEMAPTLEMQEIALRYKPNAVCLVPEKRLELTTEGGLDVSSQENYLLEFIRPLVSAGCKVSLFIAPDSEQIKSALKVGATTVELHTGAFCDYHYEENFSLKKREISRIKEMAKFAKSNGLEVHAGHGLTLETVDDVAIISEIEELNIGHSIVAEAIFYGMSVAVSSMRERMTTVRTLQ